MEKQITSLSEASIQHKKRIETDIHNALDKSVRKALYSLKDKFISLQKDKRFNETVPLSFPIKSSFDELHNSATRSDVDMAVIPEINGYYLKYIKSAKDAIGDTYLSADAQSWGVELFDKAIGAIDKDSKLHNTELAKLFDSYAKTFEKEMTYKGIVASAAMLRAEMRAVTTFAMVHFEDVARKEQVEELKRLSRKD